MPYRKADAGFLLDRQIENEVAILVLRPLRRRRLLPTEGAEFSPQPSSDNSTFFAVNRGKTLPLSRPSPSRISGSGRREKSGQKDLKTSCLYFVSPNPTAPRKAKRGPSRGLG